LANKTFNFTSYALCHLVLGYQCLGNLGGEGAGSQYHTNDNQRDDG
jgi:hypothetical protein